VEVMGKLAAMVDKSWGSWLGVAGKLRELVDKLGEL
jgi:hypothetical protein